MTPIVATQLNEVPSNQKRWKYSQREKLKVEKQIANLSLLNTETKWRKG